MISQSDASDDSYSVLTDYQGSVSASVSASGGALTLFAYSPFGKVRYQSNPDAQQDLGWLSRQFDSETGNNYLINRYYSSERGGFLSPDRYQYVQDTTPFTFNLYQYGYANPLVNVDPEGLEVIPLEPQSLEDYSYLKYTENPNLLANRTEGTKDYDIISFSDSKSGNFAYYGVWHAKSQRYVYILESNKDLTTFKEERNTYWDSNVIRKIEYSQQMTERVLRSRPYEHEATQYMESMLVGNLGDAARHFGQSWLNAVKDWHWWIDATISTALAYVSIVAENQLAARMATRERVAPAIRATRAARAARMRVARAAETDVPVMKLAAQERAVFYVKPNGVIIPSTGYRALGGKGVERALEGDIMSKSGPTYFTFNDLRPYTGQEAGRYLQMERIPSHYAEFDVLQIIDDINIPAGRWNTWRTDSFVIPEPLTRTFPEFGEGGFTQAITSTPIQNYHLRKFWK